MGLVGEQGMMWTVRTMTAATCNLLFSEEVEIGLLANANVCEV